VAAITQRFSAEEHGARLLRRLAQRRHARPIASCLVHRGAFDGRAQRDTVACHRRQPERQKRRKGGPNIDPPGYDAGKKIKGKKRHIGVDTLGLIVALVVTPGDIQDRDCAPTLLTMARKMFPSIERGVADGGYQGAATAAAVLADARIPLDIVKRSDVAKGFVVLPKRWIVERTFGWLGRCRRLAKDFENLTRTHCAFVMLAMIRLMLRRILNVRKS
jgi:transposase